MINAADVQIEDTMFLPAFDKKLQLAGPPAFSRTGIPRPQFPEKVEAERTLNPHILLTGFTLGRANECRRRVPAPVKPVRVGCKKSTEERRVGKEGVRNVMSRWSASN